jgi:hypothetical protein
MNGQIASGCFKTNAFLKVLLQVNDKCMTFGRTFAAITFAPMECAE